MFFTGDPNGVAVVTQPPFNASALAASHGILYGLASLSLAISFPGLALAGSTFKVGSFTKSTNTSVPVSQAVAHGLGVTPKALILWTEGKTDESFGVSSLFGFGVTDGTTSKSASAGSEDAQNNSQEARRIANKALTIVDWNQVLRAEADWSSWDSTNFTLSWSTNNSTGYTVHFIAIGGTDISANVVGWTMPTSTGNHSVSGVGFKPDIVIHVHAGSGFTNTPTANHGSAAFGLGVMDADGDQWATTFLAEDGSPTSDTQRSQQTDACIYAMDKSLTVTKEASWVSMDSSGFTVNFGTANSSASQAFSLALKGLNVKPGSFSKSTASQPASQSVTGVGFQPSLILLTSFQDATQASPAAHARYGIGASDGTNEGCSALQNGDALTTTTVDGIDKTSKVFVKVNNSTPAVDAEADTTSLDSGGFTLNWTTNDSVATEILYIALGSLSATEVKLRSFTAGPRAKDEGGGVVLEWKTGYEVDNLGFHLWREERGRRTRITPDLVAGSALLVGAGALVQAGGSYRFLDPAPLPPSGRVLYWLEDVDLNGRRTWHGPAVPISEASTGAGRTAKEPAAASAPASPLLRSVGCSSRSRGHTARQSAGPRSDGLRCTGRETPDGEVRAAQFRLAARGALKIAVRRDGWYRIEQADLFAAGLSPDVEPRRLQLYTGGKQVPMRVTGERDGRFDPGDAIEFYGLAQETPFTDARMYWLVECSESGMRIPTARGSHSSKVEEIRSFPFTAEIRVRTVYFAALKNGEAGNFFGAVLASEPIEETLEIEHFDPTAPDRPFLEATFQGVTASPHAVRVFLNGIDVGSASFDDQARGVLKAPLLPEWMLSGENRIAFVPEGGEMDVSLLDAVRVTYRRTFDTGGDAMRCSVEEQGRLTFREFDSPRIRVVDITRPESPQLLPRRVKREGAGYAAEVAVPGPRTLFAACEGSFLKPAAVDADDPSRWYDLRPGADMVMIAPRNLLGALAPLRALRESRGLRNVAVDVQDVYDEFGFGEKSPEALKEFLHWARENWRLPPRFVLLVGDASFDPRDFLGLGDFDLVPTKLLDTERLETASDDWLADFDGDGVAEMALGRLPVRTAAEARLVVSKIAAYESADYGEPWSREVLLIADQSDGFDFERSSTELRPLIPAEMAVRELFSGRSSNPRSDLLASLSGGQAIVNYVGHGSVEVWRGGLFSSEDARGLLNGSKLPFFVLMNCLNGFLHDVHSECLGEALLKAEGGGAAAVWAPSGLCGPEGQGAMNRALFGILFREGEPPSLGEAVRLAKAAVEDLDVRRTWIFLGDPAMQLKGPAR